MILLEMLLPYEINNMQAVFSPVLTPFLLRSSPHRSAAKKKWGQSWTRMDRGFNMRESLVNFDAPF